MSSHNELLENNHSSARKTLDKLRPFLKRHRNKFLLILSIILIVLAVYLVNILVIETFKPYFNCNYLLDRPLGIQDWTSSLCKGLNLQIGPWNIPIIGRIGPFPSNPIHILPGLNLLNGALEKLRSFVAWNIILAFAVVSLVLALIATKIKAFITLLRTPEGRKAILVNLNLWLLIFAIFSSLFYFNCVANR